jgi:ATP-dependent Lon protease
VAVTGEVTLRGRVLEIGGVKEKVLAAYRSGLRNVMLPLSNQKDLREVPEAIRGHVKFSFVSSMDEVIQELLLPETTAVLADGTADGGRRTAGGTADGGRQSHADSLDLPSAD